MAAADDLRRFQGSRYAPLAPARPEPRPAPRPKPKPKKRPKPKAPPKQARPRVPEYGPSRERVRAEGRERATGQVISPRARRVVGPSTAADRAVQQRRREANRPGRRQAPVDPDFAALLSDVEEYERGQREGRRPGGPVYQAGGFDPERIRGSEGDFIGGFLRNLGTGAVRTLVNAPAGAQWAAQNTAWPVLKGIDLATGQDSDITKQIGRESAAGFRGLAEDYKRRWGPLAEGDVRKFGERFYEDPLPTLLDVGTAYSVIGRAPAAAARGAATVVRRPMPRWASRSIIAPGEVSPATGKVSATGGRRFRPPRVLESTATAETPKGAGRGARNRIEVPRRPYSENLATQAAQRGVDRLRQRVIPRIEAAAERRVAPPGQPETLGSRAARLFTSQAKHERAQRRATRDLIFSREQRAAGVSAERTQRYDRAVRKLKPDKTAAGVRQKGLGSEQLATRLHLEDLLEPRAGMTPSQLRDAAVARMEKGLAKAAAKGERTANAQRQIEQIKAIPAELLDLADDANPAVQRVREAVEAGRELDTLSQESSIRAGVVTAETAAEQKGRTAALLLGGQEWAPAVLKEMKAAGVPKAQRQALRAASIKETPKLAQARANLSGAEAELSAASKQGGASTTLKAATRMRDRYFKAVRRQEDRALGFTPVKRPEMVGGKGVYVPKRPVDPMSGGAAFPRRRGMGGPTKAKQSKGYLTQKGGFDMNPNLLSHQAKRAVASEIGPISNQALDEFIGLAAYRDKAGKFVTGKRAAQMARSDPDRVVLVNVGSLKKVLAKLDDLEEGKFLDPGEVKMFHGEGKEPWLQAIPEGAKSTDYVAVSKAAADVWREAPTTSPILKATDSFMDYWKGGILALSPRWYVNSTLGISFQYGLLAGPDIRSIIRANRRGSIRQAIPSEVVLNNLAHDVGMKGGINAGKFRRLFEKGFRANNTMESGWRRAGYLNRAKKRLRDEGLRMRGMSDAEIAQAIDNMPPTVARQVVREVDLFLGEFRKFNRLEREVVKRVIPFYSWLRVISRLTVALPFRSPVRAQAVAVLGRAGEYGINPEDYKRPIYERGGFKVPGTNIRVPTQGFSPAGALVPAAEAASKIAEDPSSALGALGEEALAWSHPALQTLAASTFGTTTFGQPVIAPTGYAGSVQGFGGSEAINPATGMPERTRIRIPIDEALLQTFVPPAATIRRFAAGGERPFDTTRTIELLNRRLSGRPVDDLVLSPADDPYRTPVGLGFGSAFGINPYREDLAALDRRYRKRKREFEKKQRATKRRKKREARSR